MSTHPTGHVSQSSGKYIEESHSPVSQGGLPGSPQSHSGTGPDVAGHRLLASLLAVLELDAVVTLDHFH